MYHIVDDQRAHKSARKLVEGLEACLARRKYEEISISELCETAGVGRATFYRLFDNMTDVLYYQCSEVIHLVADAVERDGIISLRQAMLDFINEWMKRRKLLETLQITNQLELLHRAHMENIASFRKNIETVGHMDEVQEAYVVGLLTATLPALIRVWALRGERETAEELYLCMKSSASMIGNLL